MLYIVGVVIGSMPSLFRRNRGVDADMNVGRVEWRIAVGARENGSVHVGRVFRVARIERGGCVEGVSINCVRAMSRGASIMAARPAAETETKREVSGDDEDRMSRPPEAGLLAVAGDEAKESPGSGRARKAEREERMKDDIVEERSE